MSPRDYASFTTAAKPRFRHVAKELGFEQLTGVFYAKQRDGWYEVMGLQASQYGSDMFYVNYGIAVPHLCPVAEPKKLDETGLLLSNRLRDVDDTGAFASESKAAIEASADRVLSQFRLLASPWFAEFGTWDAIATEYYRTNPIEEEKLGSHSVVYGADFRSAIYACLLYRAGRVADARRWLLEAKRLLSLPVYYACDGRTVHEPEKNARLQKPEPHLVQWLQDVERMLAHIDATA